MRKNKIVLCILVVLIIIFLSILAFKGNSNVKEDKVIKNERETINAVYKDGRMYPMVNIIDETQSLEVKIDGIDKNSKVRIINPKNGESINIKDGKIILNNVIENDIDYGILLNDDLIGIIRSVNNKSEIDEEALTEEIYSRLKCAL